MQKKYEEVKEIKKQTDFLLIQLGEGEYTSFDIYINNIEHLKKEFIQLKLYLNDKEFIEWLQKNHVNLLNEIAMTGRLLLVLFNFINLTKSILEKK